MTTSRTICQEAHELLLAMEETYGDMVNKWRRIAEAVSRRTGACVTVDTALWVLIEAELEHLRGGAADAKHLRDVAVILAILAKVKTVDAADAEQRFRRAGVAGRTS